MNRLFFLLLFFIPLVFSCNSKKEKKISKKTEFKNGRWISTTDSTEGIEIKNGKWIWFNKKGETESIVSIYDFKILRGYIKEIGVELEYLAIITDRSDTLKYAILEYSNELLSLSYIGRGNTLNYIPEKEKEEEKEAIDKDFQEQESFLKTHNNIIWTDGDETLLFRDLESINQTKSTKWVEISKTIKGFVFDGFLKKNNGNIKLLIDQGYFIIKDNIETVNNIYDINTISGLNLREIPSMAGKIVDTLDYGISLKILNKTGEFFEIDGKKGEWVEIETYNPSGLFIKGDTDTENIYSKSLECHMCGYQAIIENSKNLLKIEKGFRGDYGGATVDNYSFSISENELIYTESIDGMDSALSTKWVPINSDSILIEEIKKSNAKKKDLFLKKKTENAERQRASEALDNEYMEREEYINYLLYGAPPIENPKDASDFYQLGMINVMSDPLKAIEYFNKAIELNPDHRDAFYERGLAKKSLNIESACDDIIKAASFEDFYMPYSAKNFIKNHCETEKIN